MRPLRAAEPGDLEALTQLDAFCFARPWTSEQWAREIAGPRGRVAVAFAGGRLVGATCVWRLGPEWELQRIAVLPDARRGGWGRDLLAEVISAARAQDADSIWLEVAQRNFAAQALYEAAGFAREGLRPNYYRDPPDHALIMRKKLI